MTGTPFPLFMKAEYQPGGAFAAFRSEAKRELDNVTRMGRASANELRQVMSDALSRPANTAGGIDLGVPKMREAAAAAQQRAAALRDVIVAAERLAAREGAMTGALNAKIAATRIELAAEEESARAKREQVVLYEALQREINETAIAQGRLAAGVGAAQVAGARNVASLGQQRAGMQQLSFQIGDVSQQLALGVNPAVVFGQQFGQIAQAMQLTTGATRGFIGFLAGPYGAVLTGVITATALWATKMGDSASAAAQAQTGADALGTAQSSLAQMFDLSTGRIVRNTEALRLNLIVQAETLRAQAIAQRQAGFRTLRNAGEYSWGSTARDIAGARFNPFTGEVSGGDRRAAVQARSVDLLMQRIGRARELPAGAARDRELNRLTLLLSRIPTDRLSTSGLDLARAGNDVMQADEIERVAREMLGSITSGQLAANLRRTQSGGNNRGGGGGNAAALAEFGEDTGRRIANITARFTETPPAVEAVRRAMGELDDIASDLERRRPPKYESLVSQLNLARTTIEQGLNGPFREWTEEQDRQRQIQTLINQGRAEEAEIVQTIFRLSEQQGKLGDEAEAEIRRRIELRAEESRQAEIERQRQQQYLQAIQSTRAGLEDAIANLNTRGLRGLGDVAQSLYGGFRQLTASSVVESLFGDTFRQLEDYVSGRGRIRAANDNLADNAQGAADELNTFKDALRGATGALTGADGGLVDKALGGALKGVTDTVKQAADDAGEILVTAVRRRGDQSGLNDLSPREFSIRTVSGLLGPLGLNEQLTRRISAGVTDAMKGLSSAKVPPACSLAAAAIPPERRSAGRSAISPVRRWANPSEARSALSAPLLAR